MAGSIAGCLLLGGVLVACTKTPPTTPTTPVSIYGALVDAGCLAADDSGLAAVQAESQIDAAPSWFGCLLEGGTVTGCNVPCSSVPSVPKSVPKP